MKKISFTIFIFLVSFIGVFAIYNYVPLKYFEIFSKPTKVGATITTIQGSDTLSASRAVINTNFSNLNTDKIEATQTTLSSLSTVGTITSGTWRGTGIEVGYGGTGTTSPTLNQVMLGNASSGFKVIGFGTSGQFLTSGGNGVAPSWSTGTTDTAANYTWTGTHLFTASTTHTATTTITASSLLNGALVLNGLAYKMPSVRGASSTVMMEDGTGNLTWNNDSWGMILSSTTVGTLATSTFTSIPARKDLRMIFQIPAGPSSGIYITFNGDTGANYASFGANQSGTAHQLDTQKSMKVNCTNTSGNIHTIEMDITNYSGVRKAVDIRHVQSSLAATSDVCTISGIWNNTSDQITSVQIGATGSITTGTTLTVYGSGI